MNRMKMPVWGVMATVALIAIAAVMLRSPYPSPLLASMVFTGATSILIFATLASMRGPQKTFWLGFAVVGWIYWFLAFGPGSGTSTRPMLVTSTLLDLVLDRLIEANPRSMNGTAGMMPTLIRPETTGEAGPLNRSHSYSWDWQRYQRIGHSLSVVAHGIGGGLILMGLEWWGRRRPATDLESASK